MKNGEDIGQFHSVILLPCSDELNCSLYHFGVAGHIHLLSHYASNRYGRNVAMLSACDKIHRLFGTEFEPIVWARSFGFHAVNAFDSVKVLQWVVINFLTYNQVILMRIFFPGRDYEIRYGS